APKLERSLRDRGEELATIANSGGQTRRRKFCQGLFTGNDAIGGPLFNDARGFGIDFAVGSQSHGRALLGVPTQGDRLTSSFSVPNMNTSVCTQRDEL